MEERTDQTLNNWEPEAWRLQILNAVSVVAAAITAVVFSLITVFAVFPDRPAASVTALVESAVFLVAAMWRSGPYQTRALILLFGVFTAAPLSMFYNGYVANTALISVAAVVMTGLLLGARWAVGGWIASTVILLSGAVAMGTGTLPTNFDPAAVDPRSLSVGVRFVLSYAALSGLLAVGVSVVVDRLSASLQNT